jgi:hypothetical protein
MASRNSSRSNTSAGAASTGKRANRIGRQSMPAADLGRPAKPLPSVCPSQSQSAALTSLSISGEKPSHISVKFLEGWADHSLVKVHRSGKSDLVYGFAIFRSGPK